MASPAVSLTNTATELNTEFLKPLLGEDLMGEASIGTSDQESGDKYAFKLNGEGNSVKIDAVRSLSQGAEKRLEWVKSQLNGRRQVIASTSSAEQGTACNIERTAQGFTVTHASKEATSHIVRAFLNEKGEALDGNGIVTPDSSIDALLPKEVRIKYSMVIRPGSSEVDETDTSPAGSDSMTVRITQDSNVRGSFKTPAVEQDTKELLLEKLFEASRRGPTK